jgi:RHH-type proline utilization regulon transcriptional repressor/proline dehydrogenase/delta 1-pyrroline-5-carboxylate dehydrogenase
LHIATFKARAIPKIVKAINATGYGLTFGLHTRIDDRVQEVVEAIHVGNIYVNRNQIGAVVGSQPFGGEGLSGTGPKAGGPHYLARFTRHNAPVLDADATKTTADNVMAVLKAGHAIPAPITRDLPGPTGESNRLSAHARPPVLCLGPSGAGALRQAEIVRALGGVAVEAPGLDPAALKTAEGFSAAIWWGDATTARALAIALAARQGPILPLITDHPDAGHVVMERHVCIDTTASGGNAQLLAQAAA